MTDTSNNPLSNNPANNDELLGVFKLVLSKFKASELDDMLPAKVIAYNRATNRAQVQPLIQMVTTRNTLLNRSQIASMPVQIDGGGGVMVGFDLPVDSLGWIKANDRDISLFKQSYLNSPPNTKRKHTFEDAVFIPCVMTGMVIATEDVHNAVFQTLDGTVCIALWPGQVKQTAPNSCITDTKSYNPSSHAVLDVQSTTRAFKFPSMTTAQRDAIPSPQGGFAVYVNDWSPNPKYSFYVPGLGWS